MIFILEKSQEQGRVKRFLGFTTYSIRGEKTFFKKFTTGQISTLAVQFSCSRQGYYCYMGTYQRRFWWSSMIWIPDNSKERHSKKQLLLETYQFMSRKPVAGMQTVRTAQRKTSEKWRGGGVGLGREGSSSLLHPSSFLLLFFPLLSISRLSLNISRMTKIRGIPLLDSVQFRVRYDRWIKEVKTHFLQA